MKERLTGAVIIVALMVLLVPALLNGPLRPAARGAAPRAEEPPLRTYTIELADNTRSGLAALRSPAPSAPQVGAAQPGSAQPVPAVPPAASARTPKVKPGTAPPPRATGSSGTAIGDGWMVQLGSFAHRANAERLAKQLRARGFQVSVSRGSAGRRLYRVRAGPTRERADAEQLALRLRATGQRGEVVRQ